MSHEIVTASGWTHLLEQLYEGAWNPDIHRFRSPFVFRGEETCDDCLATGLSKLLRQNEETRTIEGHLLRNFQKYAMI